MINHVFYFEAGALCDSYYTLYSFICWFCGCGKHTLFHYEELTRFNTNHKYSNLESNAPKHWCQYRVWKLKSKHGRRHRNFCFGILCRIWYFVSLLGRVSTKTSYTIVAQRSALKESATTGWLVPVSRLTCLRYVVSVTQQYTKERWKCVLQQGGTLYAHTLWGLLHRLMAEELLIAAYRLPWAFTHWLIL